MGEISRSRAQPARRRAGRLSQGSRAAGGRIAVDRELQRKESRGQELQRVTAQDELDQEGGPRVQERRQRERGGEQRMHVLPIVGFGFA